MVKEAFASNGCCVHNVGMYLRGTLVGLFGLLLAGTVMAKDLPLPKLRPSPLRPVAKTVPGFPAIPFLVAGWKKDEIVAAQSHCATMLRGLDIKYQALAPLGSSGGCGSAAPILISAIGNTSINPPAEANCDFAEALYGWVTSSLLPAAREYLHQEVTVINNASAYACRRRNGLSSGKLSEHGKANALDISTLKFSDGAMTSIKGDWTGAAQLLGVSDKGKFLRRLRRDACIRFTTVLGPGSDKYHGDHFHLDLAQRRGGFRICK